MANILVLAEVSNGKVKTVTHEILSHLPGHQVSVLGINELSEDCINDLAAHGGGDITILKNDKLNDYSPEAFSSALHNFIKSKEFDYVFSGATSLGKDLFPRLATTFEAGLASDVVELKFDGDKFIGTRPMFAGKCLADIELTGPKPHFVTFRPNSLGVSKTSSTPVSKNEQAAEVSVEVRAKIAEIVKGASEKLDLTEANIIVSGGRAMGNAENFKVLNELADVLGATVGASRAAVDSGYAPHSMQVGQTGKTVAPTLYIACGISGAIQHLAGMRTSKVIVAINNDKDAPIFSKADYGIVGDLFKVVPLLTDEFKKALNK
jgi:electron transfer flavoprotein alpha subunit